jgi:multidrug efflux system outer membrane protein
MMKKIPLLVLALLTASSFAAAAPAGLPLELSWQDCVAAALSNNPALKAKKLTVEQYEYLYQAGFNSYLPSVNLSHSISRSGSQLSSPSDNVNTSLSATEPLFNLEAMSSIRSAKIAYEKADADYRAASANLRQTLYSAFVSLVYAQDNVDTQKQILVIRQNNSQLVKLDYDSGTESRGNMMYAVALTQLSSSSVVQAERSLDSARIDLLSAMGFSDYSPIVAKATLAAPDYTFDAANLKNLVESIPQIVSQEKSLEGLRERLVTAKDGLYPTLNASQSVGWSGDREFAGSRNWSLGLSLNLPIFSNGITYYSNNEKAADRALKSGEASLADAKNTLEDDIRNGYNSFLNAKDNALVNVAVLSADEERYKEAQIKYQAGLMSFIDLETTEQTLVDAQLNQLSYFQRANTSMISLQSLLGVGLENE